MLCAEEAGAQATATSLNSAIKQKLQLLKQSLSTSIHGLFGPSLGGASTEGASSRQLRVEDVRLYDGEPMVTTGTSWLSPGGKRLLQQAPAGATTPSRRAKSHKNWKARA